MCQALCLVPKVQRRTRQTKFLSSWRSYLTLGTTFQSSYEVDSKEPWKLRWKYVIPTIAWNTNNEHEIQIILVLLHLLYFLDFCVCVLTGLGFGILCRRRIFWDFCSLGQVKWNKMPAIKICHRLFK